MSDDDDEDDEPTLSYTHAEIQQMREPVVRPEDFVNFGNCGTPAGMVGSRNEARMVLVGVCGDIDESELELVDVEELGPSDHGPSFDHEVADVPLSRAANGWSPAQPEFAAPPLPIEAPIDELDAFEAKLVRRRRSTFAALAIGLVVLALIVIGVVFDGDADAPAAATTETREPVEAAPIIEPESEPEPEPDADAELAPEPIAEPELGQGREPVPVPPSPTVVEEPDKKRGKSKPRTPAHQTSKCASERSFADNAKSMGDWALLEKHTRSSKCWKDKNRHRALRMDALFQLGRLRECVKLGGTSRNKVVKSKRDRCKEAQK